MIPLLRRVGRRSELVWRARDLRDGRPRGRSPAPGALRTVVHSPNWLRWDRMRQRPHAILSALARAGHPVCFVERGGRTRIEEGVEILPSLRPVPRSGAILYTHFAPDRRGFARFDDPVVVYDVLDDLSIYAAGEAGLPVGRRVASHHDQLVQEADVVMASSAVLADRLRPTRDDVLLVPNGVDLARFEALAAPTSHSADGSIVGYVGALAPWVDFGVLEAIADRPGWRLVLVGPIDPGVADRVAALESRPDVTVTGLVPFDAVPDHVASFDVGIVPFVLDRLTEAVDPLKMYEYLAAGRGVVATPLPACRGVDEVDVAAGADAFIAAIARRLAMDPAAVAPRARAAARGATWDVRIAPLLDRLEDAGLGRVPA